MTYTISAEALGHRLKATCKTAGLDVHKCASRYTGDRLLAHWSDGFGPLQAAVKGGHLFPQTIRATSDVDVQVARRYTEDEVIRAFGRLAPILSAEGIELERIHPEKLVWVPGLAQPVSRYRIDATTGGVRGNTSLDMSVAVGPYAWPKRLVQVEMPSFLPRTPSSSFVGQRLETSAAEKWLAVLTQDYEDHRVKHHADLILMDGMSLDGEAIAKEVIRICRHRGLLPKELPVAPDTLSWSVLSRREQSWATLSGERRMGLSWDQAWIDLNGWWREIHARVQAALLAERPRTLLADLQARERRADTNVVAFRPRFH